MTYKARQRDHIQVHLKPCSLPRLAHTMTSKKTLKASLVLGPLNQIHDSMGIGQECYLLAQ